MERILALVFVILTASIPIVSAQETAPKGLLDQAMQITTNGFNLIWTIALAAWGGVQFYVLGDKIGSAVTQKSVLKARSLNSLQNDMFWIGCCGSQDCYVNSGMVCTQVCSDCSTIKGQIEAYYEGLA